MADLKVYDPGADLILINECHSEGRLRELIRTMLVETRSPTDHMRSAGAVFFELNDSEAAEAAASVRIDMIDAALAE